MTTASRIRGIQCWKKKKSNFANLLLHRRAPVGGCRLNGLRANCRSFAAIFWVPLTRPHHIGLQKMSILCWLDEKNWVKKRFFTDNLLVCSHNIKAYSHGSFCIHFLKRLLEQLPVPTLWLKLYVIILWCHTIKRSGFHMWSWTTYKHMYRLHMSNKGIPSVIGTKCSNEVPLSRNLMKFRHSAKT